MKKVEDLIQMVAAPVVKAETPKKIEDPKPQVVVKPVEPVKIVEQTKQTPPLSTAQPTP